MTQLYHLFNSYAMLCPTKTDLLIDLAPELHENLMAAFTTTTFKDGAAVDNP
jgi:hypothetical protein